MQHTARVLRYAKPVDPTTGLPNRGAAPTTVAASLECLVEGLPARGRSTILGRVSGARYVVSWIGTQLRTNDVLDTIVNTVTGQAIAGRFRLAEIVDDSTRPARNYYTGILAEFQ